MIEIDQLNSQELPPDQEMVITIELKSVEAELDVERIKSESSTVNVEVIDKETIQDWLNGKNAFGIVPPVRKRTDNVPGSGLIRHWADRVSN